MANLFRQEVVARRGAALFEGVVLQSSARSTLLSVAALALALGVVAVACIGTYSAKERAFGTLVPDAGLIVVTTPRAGVISHLAVRSGDLVAPGQPLFTVASQTDAASGVNADAAHLDLLITEREVLVAQIDAEVELADAQSADLVRRAAFHHDQASLFAEQQASASRRIGLLQVDLNRLDQLAARGHVAANLLDLKLVEVLDARQTLVALKREHGRHSHEARELEQERAGLPRRRDIRIAELNARLLALDRAIATADAQWATTVRAPTAGWIEALRVHPGETVVAGSATLSVVPAGSTLRVELMLPTRAAGFIEPGQQVRVRYDAFPYQKFGLHAAVVRSVDRAALSPDEQRGVVRLQVPAYRVVADIEHQSMRAYGDDIALRPGLTLQADVLRDRRRLIEWLFEPVIAAMSR